ncbi:suppressor of fused domain protein [Fuerstiella marisgermanici]|uniref:Suppressor of fused protein (SUFU) n=1 Tax=Fuerstiella marisgermanici TaxID=1891926 RepID=A0A1P8WGW5_9PLAN|nr:suppressor of fused domain protein [Fuerstiella marisgermanici]APZ93326.1 Suppressor of fused protein (SUFU) [Fuerstiella marisgermanici]
MLSPHEKHEALTAVRTKAYEEFFGGLPSVTFSPDTLFKKPDERFLIDIFVYTLEADSGDIEVTVTNGMSDQRMVDAAETHCWSRRELIQYFPKCTEGHARRLHNMAWLPLFDGFLLNAHHSITWEHPAVSGTPWKNAFFLTPLIKPHREEVCEVEGDSLSFLWHVPISDEEMAYRRDHGADALIDRMEAVELPWIFDEDNRPDLLGN